MKCVSHLVEETKIEKDAKHRSEEHGHIHYVRYKTKKGNIKIYRYVYGKAVRKSLVNKVKET